MKSYDEVLEKASLEVQKIFEYVQDSSGLDGVLLDEDFRVTQKVDGKFLAFPQMSVEEVLFRTDGQQQPFLQVNFVDNRKILLTDQFVGFKPVQMFGLGESKLPKVVTTSDLVSVVDAIEDSLNSDAVFPAEVSLLKKVFESVLRGGEEAGFDLSEERLWISRLSMSNCVPASA